MKKRIFALLAILTLLLVGCGNDDTTVFDKVNTIDGVTLTLKEDTLKASKATFVLKNDSNRLVNLILRNIIWKRRRVCLEGKHRHKGVPMETGRNGNPARRRISGNNSGVEGALRHNRQGRASDYSDCG